MTPEQQKLLLTSCGDLITSIGQINTAIKNRASAAEKDLKEILAKNKQNTVAAALLQRLKPLATVTKKAYDLSKDLNKYAIAFQKGKITYPKFRPVVERTDTLFHILVQQANDFREKGKSVKGAAFGVGVGTILSHCITFPEQVKKALVVTRTLPGS